MAHISRPLCLTVAKTQLSNPITSYNEPEEIQGRSELIVSGDSESDRFSFSRCSSVSRGSLNRGFSIKSSITMTDFDADSLIGYLSDLQEVDDIDDEEELQDNTADQPKGLRRMNTADSIPSLPLRRTSTSREQVDPSYDKNDDINLSPPSIPQRQKSVSVKADTQPSLPGRRASEAVTKDASDQCRRHGKQLNGLTNGAGFRAKQGNGDFIPNRPMRMGSVRTLY